MSEEAERCQLDEGVVMTAPADTGDFAFIFEVVHGGNGVGGLEDRLE
jgi:hypothetical protein